MKFDNDSHVVLEQIADEALVSEMEKCYYTFRRPHRIVDRCAKVSYPTYETAGREILTVHVHDDEVNSMPWPSEYMRKATEVEALNFRVTELEWRLRNLRIEIR